MKELLVVGSCRDIQAVLAGSLGFRVQLLLQQ